MNNQKTYVRTLEHLSLLEATMNWKEIMEYFYFDDKILASVMVKHNKYLIENMDRPPTERELVSLMKSLPK